jgi:hypothetical protein
LKIFLTFTMDSSLSSASIAVVIKRVETFGDGVLAPELFCPAQNFQIPSHHCGKTYGGLAGLKDMAGGASKPQLGEEQIMVNLRARP